MNLKGYKTLLFNAAAALGAILDLALNSGGMLSHVFGTPERAATATFIIGAANVLLRTYTNTPMGSKGPPGK